MIPFSYDKYKAGTPVIRRDGGTPPIAVVETPDGHDLAKLVAVFGNGNSYPVAADGKMWASETGNDIGHPDPKPKYRPWTPEEVPPCCEIREKTQPKGNRRMILSVDDRSVITWEGRIIFSALLDNYETLNGKPCGVEVGE